jgi:hypothetical protein
MTLHMLKYDCRIRGSGRSYDHTVFLKYAPTLLSYVCKNVSTCDALAVYKEFTI